MTPPRQPNGSWDVYAVALKGGVWAATVTVLGWLLLDTLFGVAREGNYYVQLWFPAACAAGIALYQRENREWPLGGK